MITMLKLAVLNVSESYQRTIKPSRVKAIVRHFDPDAVGSLCVGQRIDGSFWVVDGQQRKAALEQIGIEQALCDVFESSGPSHEAKIFRHKNKDRTGITPFIIYRALLTEGDSSAVSINTILEERGIIASDGSRTWPHLRCISALFTALESGGEANLRDVLDVICDAWEGEVDAFHSTVVSGISMFLMTYKDASKERLISVLSKKQPVAITRAADAYKMWSGTRPKAVCEAVFNLYNKGLRNKLEQKVFV